MRSPRQAAKTSAGKSRPSRNGVKEERTSKRKPRDEKTESSDEESPPPTRRRSTRGTPNNKPQGKHLPKKRKVEDSTKTKPASSQKKKQESESDSDGSEAPVSARGPRQKVTKKVRNLKKSQRDSSSDSDTIEEVEPSKLNNSKAKKVPRELQNLVNDPVKSLYDKPTRRSSGRHASKDDQSKSVKSSTEKSMRKSKSKNYKDDESDSSVEEVESSDDDDEVLIVTPKKKTPIRSSSRNKSRNESIIECDDSSDEDDEDESDSGEEARDEMIVNMSSQIGNLRKLLNTKEAEIRRLKNELKEKNESLEGMEETMLKNMMLESEVQKLQFTHHMKKATTRDTGVGTSDADFPTAMPPPPSIMLKPTRTQQEIEADKKRQAEVDRVTAERAELAKKANVINITAQPLHRPNILSNTLGATRYTYTTQPNPQIYPRPAAPSTTTLGYQGNQYSNPQSQAQTQSMIDNIMKELYPGGATVAQPNNLTLDGSAVTAQSTVKPTPGPTPVPKVTKPIPKKAQNDDDDCVDITDDVIDKEIEDEMTSTSGEESDSDDEDTEESDEDESDESEEEDSEEDEDESEDEEDNDESPDEEKDEKNNKSKSTKNKKAAADDIIAISDDDNDEKPKSRKKLNMDIDVAKTPERRTSRRGMSQSESEKSLSKAPSSKQGQSKTDKSKNQTPRKTRTKAQSDTESEASSNIKTESESKGKTDTKEKKLSRSKDKPNKEADAKDKEGSKEDSKVETKPPTRRSLRGEAPEIKESEKSTRSTRSKLDTKDSKANTKDSGDSDEEKRKSKKQTRGTKKNESSSENEEDEKENAPKKKTRGTKSKDLASDSDDDESEENSTTTKRVTRGGKKNDVVKEKASKDKGKSAKDDSEEDMEEDESSQRPTRASKRKLKTDEDKAGPVKKSKRGKGNQDSSEDEEEETAKGKKGKKQTKKPKKKGKGKKGKKDDTESDAYEDISYEDSDEEEKDAKMRKKKRKKKKKDEKSGKKKGKGKKGKTKETTDEESDEDDEKDGTPHGRRNIKRILGKKKLSKKTVRAEKEEEERRERVKKQNEKFKKKTVIDPKSPTKCPITTKLVLESHSKTNRSIIKVNSNLITKLKPHQVEAVEFLWDCIVENLKTMRSSTGSGAILAHCMGLGKTLSSISLVHTLLSHQNLTKMKTCLVVCPLNTILNWVNEWEKWFDEEDQLDVYELATAKDNKERGIRLRKWTKSGGVMVMGYSLFRILAMSNTKSKALKKTFEESLINPGPDLVVCDEGHILKNESSAISQCMNNIRTRRRIVLTGTPLQNNLIEYHCMVNFVKPNLLGTTREFKNRFVNPISNGQCVDSTPRDHKIMKRRAHVLHEMLVGCVQRRDYSALTKFLPPKHEYVISVRLSEAQIKLYEEYLRINLNTGPDGKIISHGARLFSDYQELMRIWTHPWVLQLNEVIREKIRQKELDEESVDSFDEDEEEDEVTSDQTTTSSESISSSEESDDSEDLTKRKKRSRKAKLKPRQDDDARDIIHGERVRGWRNTRLNKEKKSDDEIEELREKPPPPWWEKFVKEDDEYKMELSGKLMLMFEIVKLAGAMGDKVLVFSQSLLSLDLIESFLEHMHNQAEEKNKKKKKTPAMNMEKWEKGKDYYRFDGSTNAKLRKKYQQEFSKNKRARLFLISTKAGSLGINLDKANRVIIFDASWNPSHDVQSIFRVYRFGQVKDVFVYRFLAQGTMEEKIYERQIEKLSLSQRVIDEHQIERHFNSNDLKELYNFQPDRLEDKKERPTPKLPKDVILTEILKSKKDHIVSYQEHDSLLEHLVEEELNEDERKAAWEEYENEKKGMMRYGGFGAIGQNLSSGNSAFGLQQLPRVVQEILKYNPNIPPQELQTRLQAFLKLQTPQQGLQQRPVQSSAFPGGNYLRGPQTQGVAIQPRPSYATTTIPNPNLIGNPPVRIGQPAVYNPSTQNIIRVSQPGLPSRLPGVGTIPGLGVGPMNVIRVNASNGTVQVNGASK